ncbi:MAG: DEAD/DEAH box helicase [Methylococcaceae bacterium]|nr:DEAD/DEAH box helicase [Methylococcaceae bacterium]
MSFDSLGLTDALLKAVADQGYSTPTPIQLKAIPVILEGKDILAGAQTGTGKTAGFSLPLLQRLAKDFDPKTRPRKVRALILVPTRELASQVFDSIQTYGKYLPLTAQVIVGGVSINVQTRLLRQGCDIVVATPGRLTDHLFQKHVNLSDVETLILDEADRMLDMGFLPDIRRIMTYLPKKRQTLLFSATMPGDIKALADSILNNPVQVEIAKQNATADTVSELIYGISKENKRELLSYLIGSNNWQQVLVFVRTKHGADRLEKQLIKDGVRAASLHGDKTQAARTKALELFKSGKVTALVATDIAARGLDIEELPHVINFDLPQVAEDYIHRIGRTGRAGLKGAAISLVCTEDAYLLGAIEKLLKRQIPRVNDTGYEPISLRSIDASKKSATANKTSTQGKKDFRHHNKKKPGAKNESPTHSRDDKPKQRSPTKR